MTLAVGAYLFLIAFALAHLEIQIEGPHGWAAKLPTWRWDSPGVRRWLGKPVTGYHVWLMTVILLLLHVPQFYGGSWEREADLLAMFFLLAVTWDVLWFGCNRHFGMALVSQGRGLVVPDLDPWRTPALPHDDRALPRRRPRARPLDGRVGKSRAALGPRLLRAARADDGRDRHQESRAAVRGCCASHRREDQTRVVGSFLGLWIGPSLVALEDSSPVTKTTAAPSSLGEDRARKNGWRETQWLAGSFDDVELPRTPIPTQGSL